MRFFVYVIWNTKHRRYYVGQTSDLEKRVRQHNDPLNDMSKFTKRFDGAWVAIHTENFGSRAEAMRRERELKSGKGRQWLGENILPME